MTPYSPAHDRFASTMAPLFGGPPNLRRPEAVASVVFGLLLAAAAVRRPNWRGLLMGLTGGAFVARGMTRHCPMKAAFAQDHEAPRMGYRVDPA